MPKPAFPRKIAQDFILKLIKDKQPISLYKLSKLLGYSYSGAKDYIQSLVKKGLIKTELKLNEEGTRTIREISIK